MTIIFCVHPAISDSNSAGKGLVEKWHSNNYWTRTCVSPATRVPSVKYIVSSEYNLHDSCLSSAYAAWLAIGTHGTRTRSTPHGTSPCILKVSCSNFKGSVGVQLEEMIHVKT
jgi:hypothetical protein